MVKIDTACVIPIVTAKIAQDKRARTGKHAALLTSAGTMSSQLALTVSWRFGSAMFAGEGGDGSDSGIARSVGQWPSDVWLSFPVSLATLAGLSCIRPALAILIRSRRNLALDIHRLPC